MLDTMDTTATAPRPQAGSWLGRLDRNEKRTLAASFGGYGVDAFDYYTLPLVTPILLSLWGVSKTEIGLIGTSTLISSAIGGWLAGILADRYGPGAHPAAHDPRVRDLHVRVRGCRRRPAS
jgi:sugar phosphate permease